MKDRPRKLCKQCHRTALHCTCSKPPVAGAAPCYDSTFQQSDLAALASAADEIAFARHHLKEREWDEVEHCLQECEDFCVEVRNRMFSIRHGQMAVES